MRVTDMDFTGRKFGRLSALSTFHDGKIRRWICQCDCGNKTQSRCHDLYTGRATSCGCLNTENRQKGVTKHGLSQKRQYFIWQAMIRRCYAPIVRDYHYYGGRGITVCDRWRESFENFWEDMKEGYAPNLTIDRKDPDGNYEKGNCRWSSKMEQQNNRRNNTYISAFGESLTAPQWSRKTGISTATIRSRLRWGWEPEKALSHPVDTVKASYHPHLRGISTRPTAPSQQSQ